MKQTLQSYFLVRSVEAASRKLSNTVPLIPSEIDVRTQYFKWHRFTSLRKYKVILKYTEKAKYIKCEVSGDKDLKKFNFKDIQLLDDGYRLLDTYPIVHLPSGLIEVWWKEDNIAVKTLIALVFGGIGVAIYHFIIAIYRVIVWAI